jgi:hypothetical protein
MHVPLHEAVLTLLGYAPGGVVLVLIVMYIGGNGIDCYNACP